MLHLRLLGEPLLTDSDGRAVPVWRPHAALLAYLAVAPRGYATRSTLAGTIWPEVPESAARGSLRQALFRLRRDTGDLMVVEGDGLRLDESRLTVDVRRLEAVLTGGLPAAAVELYGGAFLANFSLPASPGFNLWADGERARLEAAVLCACEGLVEEAAAGAQWRDALRWAEWWSRLDPYSETAGRHVVALRAQVGDRGGALAASERLRARISDDLGLTPSPSLERLLDRVRRMPLPEPAGAPGTPPRVQRSPPEPPLVGRAAEFARLTERWEAARQGTRQSVVIVGEPGIGKSRLAGEFVRRIGLSEATVLVAGAYEVERGVPYATLASVLRAALAAPGLAGAAAASLGEVSRIVPEYATRFEKGIESPAGDPEGGRLRLLEAVRDIVESLAYEAPVVIFIDDLPWADEATLAALHYQWRTLPEAPLFLLATARSEDMGTTGAAGRWLAALQREAGAAVDAIDLAPLDREAVSCFLKDAGALTDVPDAEALCDCLQRESGGNPLFLVQSVHVGRFGRRPDGLSTTMRAAVDERIQRISGPARRLLQAAAVLGRRFPLPLASAVAGLKSRRSLDALDELVVHRLVRQVGYQYDFSHDVVRTACYRDLAAERRRILHRRAFDRLVPEPGGPTVGLSRAGALAMHAAGGGLRRRTYEWSLHSATLAKRVFAGAEAIRFLEQAADSAATEPERRKVAEELGDAFYVQSRFRAAALAYFDALRTAGPGTEDRLRLRVKTLDTALRSGLLGLDNAAPVMDEVAAQARSASPRSLRDALLVAAHAHAAEGRFGSAEAYAVRAVEGAHQAAEAEPLVRALLLRARRRHRRSCGCPSAPGRGRPNRGTGGAGPGPVRHRYRLRHGTQPTGALGRSGTKVDGWGAPDGAGRSLRRGGGDPPQPRGPPPAARRLGAGRPSPGQSRGAFRAVRLSARPSGGARKPRAARMAPGRAGGDGAGGVSCGSACGIAESGGHGAVGSRPSRARPARPGEAWRSDMPPAFACRAVGGGARHLVG